MTKTVKQDAGAEQTSAGVATTQKLMKEIPAALMTGGRAYAGGLVEIGRVLGGFGREVVAEIGRHGKATLQARNLGEVAELQAAFVQHRLEVSTAHAKELADLAYAKSEQVIAPFVAVLKQDRKAA